MAITSAAHLKEFLKSSGREFVVLRAEHLVDTLWADGVAAFQAMVDAYRDYRRAIPSGYVRKTGLPPPNDLETGYLEETLELHELEELQRWVSARLDEAKARHARLNLVRGG